MKINTPGFAALLLVAALTTGLLYAFTGLALLNFLAIVLVVSSVLSLASIRG